MKKISFIIPCYRSSNTVSAVIDEIVLEMNNLVYEYEIIPINDCSPDNVWEVLEDIARRDDHVKAISLAKNFGRTSAIMAGMSYADGDIIVILDDDGQCPMDRVKSLIEPIEKQEALATFAKYPKKEQSLFKNFGSALNAYMSKNLIGKPADLQVSNFCAVGRDLVKEVLKYTGPYPYFSGLLLRATNKIVNVPMVERKRMQGGTTFTLKKLVGMVINGFTAFSVKPLRIATVLGSLTTLSSVVCGIVTLINCLRNASGFNTLAGGVIALILFLNGLIMLLLGMVGEYLGRVYITLNNAPQYTIEKMVNFDTK